MPDFTGDNPDIPIIFESTPSVDQGDIPTDTSSLYDETDFNIFTDYEITSRYERDNHIYMMGITSPNGFQGNSVAFAQLASPTTLLVVDWTGCKYNECPEIPNIDATNPNWVLLDEVHEPASVVIGSDGTNPLYRISGVFTYGLKNPSQLAINDLQFPAVAWLDTSQVFRFVTSSNLDSNLIISQ